MKIFLLAIIAICGAIIFGGAAYLFLFGKALKGTVFTTVSFFNFDRILSLINLAVTVILTLVGLYVAYKSLVIAKITYDQAQESGPKTDAILTGSRDALQLTVDILKKQQIATDSSRKALELVSASALRQQKLLEESLNIAGSQLEISRKEKQSQDFIERRNLDITISKMFALFPLGEKGMDVFDKYARSAKVEWAKSQMVLFESGSTNPVLLEDEKAKKLWIQAIYLLRYQATFQDENVLRTMNPPPKLQNNTDFKRAASKTWNTLNYTYYKLIAQNPTLAESFYNAAAN